MEDLDSLRRKKLEALKKRTEAKNYDEQDQQGQSHAQQNSQDAKFLALARQICDEKAYDRLTNIKIVNPELFTTALQTCASIYQKYQRKIDDKTLIKLLSLIQDKSKQDNKIEFKRK